MIVTEARVMKIFHKLTDEGVIPENYATRLPWKLSKINLD
jgi:hypothetical protein